MEVDEATPQTGLVQAQMQVVDKAPAPQPPNTSGAADGNMAGASTVGPAAAATTPAGEPAAGAEAKGKPEHTVQGADEQAGSTSKTVAAEKATNAGHDQAPSSDTAAAPATTAAATAAAAGQLTDPVQNGPLNRQEAAPSDAADKTRDAAENAHAANSRMLPPTAGIQMASTNGNIDLHPRRVVTTAAGAAAADCALSAAAASSQHDVSKQSDCQQNGASSIEGVEPTGRQLTVSVQPEHILVGVKHSTADVMTYAMWHNPADCVLKKMQQPDKSIKATLEQCDESGVPTGVMYKSVSHFVSTAGNTSGKLVSAKVCEEAVTVCGHTIKKGATVQQMFDAVAALDRKLHPPPDKVTKSVAVKHKSSDGKLQAPSDGMEDGSAQHVRSFGNTPGQETAPRRETRAKESALHRKFGCPACKWNHLGCHKCRPELEASPTKATLKRSSSSIQQESQDTEEDDELEEGHTDEEQVEDVQQHRQRHIKAGKGGKLQRRHQQHKKQRRQLASDVEDEAELPGEAPQAQEAAVPSTVSKPAPGVKGFSKVLLPTTTVKAVQGGKAAAARTPLGTPRSGSGTGQAQAPVAPHSGSAVALPASTKIAVAHARQLSPDESTAVCERVLALLPPLPGDQAENNTAFSAQFVQKVTTGLTSLLKELDRTDLRQATASKFLTGLRVEEGRAGFCQLFYPMLLGMLQAKDTAGAMDVLEAWLAS